jgi:hypothetical protein
MDPLPPGGEGGTPTPPIGKYKHTLISGGIKPQSRYKHNQMMGVCSTVFINPIILNLTTTELIYVYHFCYIFRIDFGSK